MAKGRRQKEMWWLKKVELAQNDSESKDADIVTKAERKPRKIKKEKERKKTTGAKKEGE